jgi:hypothetical protein
MPFSHAFRPMVGKCRTMYGRNSRAPIPNLSRIRSWGANELVTAARVATGYDATISTATAAAT